MQLALDYQTAYLDLRIRTDNPGVHRLIRRYLDLLPQPATIERLKVEFELLSSAGDESVPFFHHQFSQTHGYETICGRPFATAHADLPQGKVHARIFDFHKSVRESVFETIFMRPLRMILAYRGFSYLHSAVVASDDGRCLVIAGPSGSGKTTLSLSLLESGLRLFTDDSCFVRREESEFCFYPFGTKVGVDRALALRLGITAPPGSFTFGNKLRVSARSFPSIERPSRMRCAALILPTYAPGEPFEMHEMDGRLGFESLMRGSFSRFPQDGEQRQLIARNFFELNAMARSATFYRVKYNQDTIADFRAAIEARLAC